MRREHPLWGSRRIRVKTVRSHLSVATWPGSSAREWSRPVPRRSVASNTGVIMVVGQKVALGRIHQHQTGAVLVSDATLTVEFGDGDTRVIRRTTTQPVRSIKGQRSRTATSFS